MSKYTLDKKLSIFKAQGQLDFFFMQKNENGIISLMLNKNHVNMNQRY